ncbi:MFS transporter [Streptomyces sp. H10-C2]|uniref:MFS transporter n=1 Tax=unclassified Streptomyces TaxID=2593676 RepID=UPI0024B8B7AF|nr:MULTISPECIES: MFS transporter [unclassified Streptomyces]MDJ0341214.1 MFS transporter [Streptomyces sp. PH10-H1]MDJ0369433.1 MFS transporter [Streptomyces sp. H10-C2]
MTSTPAPPPRTTYHEVLANPRFRLLFVTRAATITADSLRIMTLSVLVFATTGSPLMGALTFGIGFLPQLAGSMLLGSLADRVRPRRLIVAGYVLEFTSAALMGLAHLPVAAILVLVAVVACLTPVFGGASNRLVAETLTGDAYVLGRSLSNMSSSGAQLLGLAGGGVAVTLLGSRHALLLSAGVYLVAAIAVRLRLPDLPAPDLPPPGQGSERGSDRGSGSLVRHSWAGNKGLFADRRVRKLLLAQWLPSAFAASAESLIVPFAGRRGFPAGTAGFLLACLPVGMLIGNLVVGRFVRPATRERLVATLVAVLGLPLVGFVLNPPWAVCAVLLLITGTGFAYGLGLQRAFLDAVPEAGRGQAFGLLTSGMMTVQGVGPAVFGVVAELASVGAAMALAGLATVCVAGYLTRESRGSRLTPLTSAGTG